MLATGVLGLFAVALALFGAGQGAALEADVLTLTAASLATLSVYLIPLIALLMSCDALAGEIERGTLALTFATSVRRWEVFAGKFAAQAVAVSLAIGLAFGCAGVVAGLLTGTAPECIVAWLRLMGTAMALGVVFVGVDLMLSALTGRGGSGGDLAAARDALRRGAAGRDHDCGRGQFCHACLKAQGSLRQQRLSQLHHLVPKGLGRCFPTEALAWCSVEAVAYRLHGVI